MLLGARQTFWHRGESGPTLLDWISTSGNAYILTQAELPLDYYAFEAEFGHDTTLAGKYYDGVIFGMAGFTSDRYTEIATGSSHYGLMISRQNFDRIFWATNGRSWWGWNGSNVVTISSFCSDSPIIRHFFLGTTTATRPTTFTIDSLSKQWDGGDLGFVFPVGVKLAIFGMSFSDGVVRPCAGGLFFRRLRIYNSSRDICDYRAAKTGDAIGVYDTVSGTFTPGTGTFSYGAEIT